MPRPNFFIVGAAKSGSTSMYEYLRQHPQVFMSPNKEPHHFSQEDLPRALQVTDRNAYLALFDDAGDATRIGEASMSYLYSKVAAQRLYEFDPQAKIIIMLRNPVDMMWSFHKQLLAIGQETIVDFEDALAAEPARLRGEQIPPGTRFPLSFQYNARADYPDQIQRFFETFPREQIHIIIFEDLKQDSLAVTREVYRFLGVDEAFEPDLTPANVTAEKNIRNVKLRKFIETTAWARKLISMLPRPIRRMMGGAVAKATKGNVDTKAKMPAGLRLKLLTAYRPKIDRLSAMLDRDLSYWYRELTEAEQAGRKPDADAPAPQHASVA